MTEPIAQINDLRSRILHTQELRAQGKIAEAEAIEPSTEEMREGLKALRALRSKITAEQAEKNAKRAEAKKPLDLQALFNKEMTK